MVTQNSELYVGIDLGGTNTKIGIGTRKGEVLQSDSILTQINDGPETWIRRVCEKVLSWKMKFEAVGIGSPGPLDVSTGTIITTPNLKPFEKFPMKKHFERLLGKPCYFDNDANCASLGEFLFGSYPDVRDMVVLTLGTGVGSGIISNGKMIRGHQGFATELGHMVIDMNGPRCGCGRRGCLEAFVGARVSRARYLELSGLKEGSQEVHMKDIFEKGFSPASNDKIAKQILEDWIHALAIGLANTISIFNPQVIILSGGVSQSWPQIKPRLEDKLKAMVENYILDKTTIETSHLGKNFGVIGSIALAAEKHQA